LPIADDIGHAETWNAGLLRAKEFAGAAQLQIEFGDLETVVRTHHGIEAAFAFFGNLASAHKHAIGLRRTTPDASAQLVELR
jgi:hypothetical protein